MRQMYGFREDERLWEQRLSAILSRDNYKLEKVWKELGVGRGSYLKMTLMGGKKEKDGRASGKTDMEDRC